MVEQRVEKWRRWIEGPIYQDVIGIFNRRQIYEGIGEIIEQHGSLPDSMFWEYHRANYASAQALAVRRHADLGRDVASLGKVIGEVRDEARHLDFDWWFKLWATAEDPNERMADEQLAGEQWSALYAKEGSESIDAERVARDLEGLQESARAVVTYVDKNLAHLDAKVPPTTVTFDDLHGVIDHIGELFRRYYGLLAVATLIELAPVPQADWLAPFRVPWILDRESNFRQGTD